MTDSNCTECGEEITPTYTTFEPEDLTYCTECWFGELSGAERRQARERAKRRRRERLNE